MADAAPDNRDRHAARRQLVHGAARLTAICGGLILLFSVLPFQSDKWWLGAAIGMAAIGAIVPVTAHRVKQISSSPSPVMAVVEALTLIASMLVLGFSGLYLTIDRHHDEFNGLDTRIDAVYFTVTTLSTVGFGDINAIGQTARVLVTVQILLNFTLFAVAVKAVTSTAAHRFDGSPAGQRLPRSRPTEDNF